MAGGRQPRWWVAAGATLILAGAIWLLWTGDDPAGAAGQGHPAKAAPADKAKATATGPQMVAPAAARDQPPTVSSRAALATLLADRDLDPDRLINAWQAWRMARGFLDANDLTGVTRENAAAELYGRMDDVTLAQLSAAGELGALQEEAARREPVDSVGALVKYMAAAERGSAAAMFGASRALLGVAALQGEDTSADPELAATLRDWRNMDGSTDIRQEALAWALAAVRTDGAAVLEGTRLAQIESLAAELDDEQLRMACAESLAYFGGYRGRDGASGIQRGRPPPVFVTTANAYARLPCGDTPAPVTPPRHMQDCQSVPAQDARKVSVEVWICPEN